METVYDNFHKPFSTYFHKLSNIVYINNLYENNLTVFYLLLEK